MRYRRPRTRRHEEYLAQRRAEYASRKFSREFDRRADEIARVNGIGVAGARTQAMAELVEAERHREAAIKAQERMNVRNYLIAATQEELEEELRISVEMGREWRAICIRELINESK